MTTWKPGISLVYPMFNEEENIERAVHFAEDVLTDMTADYEIIIVNDASTDRSPAMADALARSNARVKVFHHERNLKLGGTLRTGFSQATKELVFSCDSLALVPGLFADPTSAARCRLEVRGRVKNLRSRRSGARTVAV